MADGTDEFAPHDGGSQTSEPGRSGTAGPEPSRSRTARARAQAEHLRRRADETVKGLEARRPANRWIDAAFSTFERDVTSGGGVLAAALAFRLFIFMVPFVFVVVTALPFAASSTDTKPSELADKFGMAGLVATAIKSADGMSFWGRLSVLVVGCFALVLASRSLVRVLRITHGLAWHTRVPKLQRPTRAALVLIGAVLIVVLFGAWSSKLQDQIGVLGLLPILLAGLGITAAWTFVQYHLPHAGVAWTQLVPGALVVAAGTEVLHIVTVVWFTRYLESKSATYGAIGAALAILLWAYFLGRIIVSGAMLNAALHEQEQRALSSRPRRPSAPARPEEHEDRHRNDREPDGLDVEGRVGVEREDHQHRAGEQYGDHQPQQHPTGDPRDPAHWDARHGPGS